MSIDLIIIFFFSFFLPHLIVLINGWIEVPRFCFKKWCSLLTSVQFFFFLFLVMHIQTSSIAWQLSIGAVAIWIMNAVPSQFAFVIHDFFSSFIFNLQTLACFVFSRLTKPSIIRIEAKVSLEYSIDSIATVRMCEERWIFFVFKLNLF